MEKIKLETIIQIIVALIVITVIILVGAVAIQVTHLQLLEFCAVKDWEGVHEITGDFLGEVDCKEIWENEYANGKWTDKCSVFPFFTTKPSCHWLCVEDCKMINKQKGEINCVC